MKFPARFPPPRRAERTLLPAALTALLALLLVLQFTVPSTISLPEAEVARPLRLPPLFAAPIVIDPEITERPLFNPRRRETAEPGRIDKTAPVEGARFVGTLKLRGTTRVFLQAPDGRVTPVALGGSYKGWRLVALEGGQLVLVRGATRAVLPLTASVPPVMPGAEPTEEPQEEETE